MGRFHRIVPILVLGLLLVSQSEAREPQPCGSKLLESLARQLGQQGWAIPAEYGDGPLIAAACKRWPDDPSQSVVALAYREADDHRASGEWSLRLLLAKVDEKSGVLRERYDAGLEEDASLEVGPDSLWLDTARYHLAPGVRAFGVVLRSVARGASCPDAGFNDLLTLVVPEGARLRPVFATHLSLWTTVQGTACVTESDFEMEQASLTLSMGPRQLNGYADLIVNAKVRSGPGEEVLRTVSKTIRYDGNRYPFDEFPTFWWRKSQQ